MSNGERRPGEHATRRARRRRKVCGRLQRSGGGGGECGRATMRRQASEATRWDSLPSPAPARLHNLCGGATYPEPRKKTHHGASRRILPSEDGMATDRSWLVSGTPPNNSREELINHRRRRNKRRRKVLMIRHADETHGSACPCAIHAGAAVSHPSVLHPHSQHSPAKRHPPASSAADAFAARCRPTNQPHRVVSKDDGLHPHIWRLSCACGVPCGRASSSHPSRRIALPRGTSHAALPHGVSHDASSDFLYHLSAWNRLVELRQAISISCLRLSFWPVSRPRQQLGITV